MAGRGTDIKLGGNPEFQAQRRLGSNGNGEEYKKLLAQEEQAKGKNSELNRRLTTIERLKKEIEDDRRLKRRIEKTEKGMW